MALAAALVLEAVKVYWVSVVLGVRLGSCCFTPLNFHRMPGVSADLHSFRDRLVGDGSVICPRAQSRCLAESKLEFQVSRP